MISAHGIAISLALSDFYRNRCYFDGDFYRWARNGRPGDVYPGNEILKAVLLGRIETVN